MPGLDGLRGLAVLGVLAFHANGWLTGGYLGVDLFFVLSGYLITGLLLAERERTGRIDLVAFWGRRARRLLPALLALMPALAVYARWLARPEELRGLRSDAWATLAYVANWRLIYDKKSYWDLFVDRSPLEHTWSLAIEEQFYVVWPLVVVLLVVVLGWKRRSLFVVCVGLAMLSAARMAATAAAGATSRAYLGSDTRAVAILVGAALATALPSSVRVRVGLDSRRAALLDGAGFAALACLAASWLLLDGEQPFLYRGGFWLTELMVLVLIACAVAAPAGKVARALSFRPLSAVGTISYGVYLWHWPVDVILTQERLPLPLWSLHLIRTAVTFAIATASYRWLEKPIRARSFSRAGGARLVAGALGAAAVLLGVATRARARPAPAPAVAVTPPPSAEPATAALAVPDFRSVKSDQLPPASELRPGTLRILVVGDSVGEYLGEAMRIQQEGAHAFVAQRGVGDCSIHEPQPSWVDGVRVEGRGCADHWDTDVAELRPDVTFIVLGGAFLGPRTCHADWRKAYRDRLTFLVKRMGPDAGRVILALVPYPGERWRTHDMLHLVRCFNDELARVAREQGAETLDLLGHVCPTTDCIQLSEGMPVRHDGLHFDGPGAAETARWTLAEIWRIHGGAAPIAP